MWQVDIQHKQLCQRLLNFGRENPSFRNGRHQDIAKDRAGQVAIRGICASYLETIGLLRDETLINDTQCFESEGCRTAHRKCLLWLGSSFSNLTPPDAAKFLQKFATDAILKPRDSILIGLDRCRTVDKVKAAYGEDSKCWRAYIKNGVRNAGMIIGNEAVAQLDGGSNWKYVARWVEAEGKHMRFAQATKRCSFDVRLDSSTVSENTTHVEIDEGEFVFLNQSYKYSSAEVIMLFRTGGLEVVREWTNDNNDSSLYLLQRRGTASPDSELNGLSSSLERS